MEWQDIPARGDYRPRMALLAGVAAMVAVFILIVIKTAVYLVSGSPSVLGSLVDSVTDAVVSAMSFMAIRQSLKPADEDHRHGHGKVEGLSALMQAAMIGGAAFFLGLEGFRSLVDPEPVRQPVIAIVVMVVATLISLGLVAIQNYTLRFAPSLAVESDRAHYASDIIINAAVVVALTLQIFGAPAWTDPVFALGISLWLLRTAWGVGCGGVDMLLDREVDSAQRSRLLSLIRAHPGVLGVHDLRTRMAGMQLHASFDIEVNRDLTLAVAHDIARDVESALLSEFPHAEIMIHVDPEGEIEDSRHTVKGVHH